MALGTMTHISSRVEGNKRVRVFDVQLSAGANYTTGGEPVTPLMARMGKRIEECVPMGCATTASGTTSRTVAPRYQANGSVLLCVQTTASAEATSNSDQSTFTVRIKFVGV